MVLRAGGDLRKTQIAEKRDQVQAQPRLVAFDPTRAGWGLLEGLLADQLGAIDSECFER